MHRIVFCIYLIVPYPLPPIHFQNCQQRHLNMKEKEILGDNMLRYQKVLAENIVLVPDLDLKVKVLIWKNSIPALPPHTPIVHQAEGECIYF